jgi:hypothetical protein
MVSVDTSPSSIRATSVPIYSRGLPCETVLVPLIKTPAHAQAVAAMCSVRTPIRAGRVARWIKRVWMDATSLGTPRRAGTRTRTWNPGMGTLAWWAARSVPVTAAGFRRLTSKQDRYHRPIAFGYRIPYNTDRRTHGRKPNDDVGNEGSFDPHRAFRHSGRTGQRWRAGSLC